MSQYHRCWGATPCIICLTRLCLYQCSQISDEGARALGNLKALRDLNLGACDKITAAGVQHLALLTSLKTNMCEGLRLQELLRDLRQGRNSLEEFDGLVGARHN